MSISLYRKLFLIAEIICAIYLPRTIVGGAKLCGYPAIHLRLTWHDGEFPAKWPEQETNQYQCHPLQPERFSQWLHRQKDVLYPETSAISNTRIFITREYLKVTIQ